MQGEMTLWIVGIIVAFAVGILIGALISKDSKISLSIQKSKKELEDYKDSVSEHFGKTADLVDNLTNSYKDVFDHLGKSAHELLSEEEVKKHLQSRASKAVTLSYITEPKKAQKPLQYTQETTKVTSDTDKNKTDTADNPGKK